MARALPGLIVAAGCGLQPALGLGAQVARDGANATALFRQFDADSSGFQNKSEFAAYLTSIGHKATPAAVARVLRLADADFSWSIDPAEFEACVGPQGPCSADPTAAATASSVAALEAAAAEAELRPLPLDLAAIAPGDVEGSRAAASAVASEVTRGRRLPEEAAAAADIAAQAAAARAAIAPQITTKAFFEALAEALKVRGREWVRNIGAVYKFVLLDTGFSYTLDVKHGTGSLLPGAEIPTDVTFTLTDSDMVALVQGQLDSLWAFTNGRLSIKGDLTLSPKFGQIAIGTMAHMAARPEPRPQPQQEPQGPRAEAMAT